MINGFENPKLIIEKGNQTLGKLLIFIKKKGCDTVSLGQSVAGHFNQDWAN